MKRWLALAAAGIVALSLSGAVRAADPAKPAAPAAKGAKENRGGKLRAALEKLNLTADQKTKIKGILGTARGEVKKIREGQGAEQDKRKQARQVMKGAREKVMAVLTPEQQKQLQAELGAGKKGAK